MPNIPINIIPLHAFKDNYIWTGIHANQAFVVDPGEADPVMDFLAQKNLHLSAILITHKHHDHTGGVQQLLQRYPHTAVYCHADEHISATTHRVSHNEIFSLHNFPVSFTAFHIPGHTLGHVAYYAKPILFTGDTLFSAGCGRIFEGTAEQMFRSLLILASLPDETLIYCGHEYTLANLHFAALVEPQNTAIQHWLRKTEQLYSENKPSLPSTLKTEKQINPFLRCHETTVIASAEHYANKKLNSVVEVFYVLREWKNGLAARTY